MLGLEITIFIGLLAFGTIALTYFKYKNIYIKNDTTGFDVVNQLLERSPGQNPYIIITSGLFADEFSNKRSIIRLTKNNWSQNNIYAISMAIKMSGVALMAYKKSVLSKFLNLITSFIGIATAYCFLIAIILLSKNLSSFNNLVNIIFFIILILYLLIVFCQLKGQKLAMIEFKKMNKTSLEENKKINLVLFILSIFPLIKIVTGFLDLNKKLP